MTLLAIAAESDKSPFRRAFNRFCGARIVDWT
jgi:hypothetical protein